jgi:hypothetical protein
VAELVRDPFVVSRRVGEGWVLIPLRRHDGRLEDNMLSLAGVAARIWELLEEPLGVESLVERLEAEYAVASEELRSDVTAFLAQLEDLQAIRQNSLDGR